MTARPLTPRDEPWIDGARYRNTGVQDDNRLDLYERDPKGDTVRLFGVLLAVKPTYHPLKPNES